MRLCPGWDSVHVKDDANLHILHMVEGTFSAEIRLTWYGIFMNKINCPVFLYIIKKRQNEPWLVFYWEVQVYSNICNWMSNGTVYQTT